MFGVGPGSLVYDAAKMGLNPAEQRRKLDEALEVIVELMRGGIVTKKTDWFDLREARLQLRSYTLPMMEMVVAANRSPVGALAAGRHGIGMLSIGGTSDDALNAHANNWRLYEEARGLPATRRTGATGASSRSRMSPRRASKRTPTSSSGSRTSNATFPRSRPSRSSRPTSRATRSSIWSRPALRA
jgi:alkanesulfonate monooxygenase SsuD/methylene tetrahydromethanopterin reductase-like flavin-dependent oxidoreductase (luciferase family)